MQDGSVELSRRKEARVHAQISPVRASTRRRLIVWLVAITGILAGLLSMHTLNLESAPHAAESVASAPVAHGVAHPAAEEPAGACSTDCDPTHSMMVMACILAALATLALLAVRQITTSWMAIRTVIERASSSLALSFPLSAPSLHVLSISRT